MKILICSLLPLSVPSAGRNRLERMREALALHGVEAIIVGEGSQSVSGAWSLEQTAGGQQVHYHQKDCLFRYPSPAHRIGARAAKFYRENLAALIERFGCDGVIDYAFQAQTSRSILLAARAARVFVVADLVERFDFSWHNFLNGMLWQQQRLCDSVVPRMDGVIGISKGWCDWAERRRIPNVWIPSLAKDRDGAQRSVASANGRPFTIVFAGHWVPREVPRAILGAMRLCVDRGMDIRMHVLGNVGKGRREASAMDILVKDAILRERIIFLGFVSDEERDRQLAAADAFVLLRSDTREAAMLFPTRLPEYLLSGNPVVISRVGSFPYCFEHGKDVWFVASENRPEEIADALLSLWRDPQTRALIGGNGRRTALKEFSLEVLGAKLSAFLRLVALTRSGHENSAPAVTSAVRSSPVN